MTFMPGEISRFHPHWKPVWKGYSAVFLYHPVKRAPGPIAFSIAPLDTCSYWGRAVHFAG